MSEKKVRGINILNPVEVDREYYLKAIDYAIACGYNHIQLNGPIHNLVRSNLDGMVFYRKYSQFNDEKDADYVNLCMSVVNECLEKSHAAGIKTYMWHHELEIPNGFCEAFPEILNEYGDVEVSHPIIKDFLEHKITDFFHAYPLMDGFVLTYYETKVPLLRLKKQKLTVNEIMTYITGILYDTCKRLGKEVIVRTDATVESDYKILLDAYEKVATDDLMIMDKWTQYDWSLTLPSNYFIRNIQKNPLLIETDLFGEYFGKGKLPLMLKEHLQKRFAFCEQYNPIGYCNRIDRGGFSAFGTVNEVNLHIMKALLNGYDLETTISAFFRDAYGTAGAAVQSAMEKTEAIVKKMLFANGYYFSELSWFPALNHCKNHFYFELMRENYEIASNEWFVPVDYKRGDVQNIFSDLAAAHRDAEIALAEIEALENQLPREQYHALWVDFKNLSLAAQCWEQMARVFFHYVRYFDEKQDRHSQALYAALQTLDALDREGRAALGDGFYCSFCDVHAQREKGQNIAEFIADVSASFAYEAQMRGKLDGQKLTDYVLCASGCEGHALQKEVNFSDTLLINGELVRIPGNRAGADWSTITAHGWFSYRMKVKKGEENTIAITAGSSTDILKMKVTLGDREYVIDQPNNGKNIVKLSYFAGENEDFITVKFDKISVNMPLVYSVCVE